MVQGFLPKVELERAAGVGGGATKMFHYDQYAYGIRSNNWGGEVYTDAAAPTS